MELDERGNVGHESGPFWWRRTRSKETGNLKISGDEAEEETEGEAEEPESPDPSSAMVPCLTGINDSDMKQGHEYVPLSFISDSLCAIFSLPSSERRGTSSRYYRLVLWRTLSLQVLKLQVEHLSLRPIFKFSLSATLAAETTDDTLYGGSTLRGSPVRLS